MTIVQTIKDKSSTKHLADFRGVKEQMAQAIIKKRYIPKTEKGRRLYKERMRDYVKYIEYILERYKKEIE